MNRVCSIFSQILQLFSRLEFEGAVRKHKAERHAPSFTCWGQFVAMLFCELGHVQSLREICGGLAASEGKLKHLGLPGAPARSTLSYANEHRPPVEHALSQMLTSGSLLLEQIDGEPLIFLPHLRRAENSYPPHF